MLEMLLNPNVPVLSDALAHRANTGSLVTFCFLERSARRKPNGCYLTSYVSIF